MLEVHPDAAGREFHVARGSGIFAIVVVFLAVLTLYLGVKTGPQGYN